ncbi:MAG: hypothetical protein WBA92_05600 [Pseudorhodobacter sp.]
MHIVSIGGMRLRHWSRYFKVLWQTGALIPMAGDSMVSFFNHKFESEALPSRAEAVRRWRAEPKAQVVEAAQ